MQALRIFHEKPLPSPARISRTGLLGICVLAGMLGVAPASNAAAVTWVDTSTIGYKSSYTVGNQKYAENGSLTKGEQAYSTEFSNDGKNYGGYQVGTGTSSKKQAIQTALAYGLDDFSATSTLSLTTQYKNASTSAQQLYYTLDIFGPTLNLFPNTASGNLAGLTYSVAVNGRTVWYSSTTLNNALATTLTVSGVNLNFKNNSQGGNTTYSFLSYANMLNLGVLGAGSSASVVYSISAFAQGSSSCSTNNPDCFPGASAYTGDAATAEQTLIAGNQGLSYGAYVGGEVIAPALPTSPVPEAEAWQMFGAGVLCAVGIARRRKAGLARRSALLA